MQVLEGAHEQYSELTGPLVPTDRPMVGLLFANRTHWTAFTQANTGAASDIYLKIVRGGYTFEDRFVIYDIGTRATQSVAAHEGWHQYLNRHLEGRLPPFLEEGFACMFENPSWDNGLPRWNPRDNPLRRSGLIRAVHDRDTWTLEELFTLHAGQIVERNPDRAEAFYAQAWAFAMFLRYAENGRYRPALRALFRDASEGATMDPTGAMSDKRIRWNPRGVRPTLEYYLEMPFARIEQAYWRYVEQLIR